MNSSNPQHLPPKHSQNIFFFTEVLADPSVVAKVSDTKAMGEVRALEQFYTMLQIEPAKAFYGLKHIQRANEAQAIETLLISDNLFRQVKLVLLLFSASILAIIVGVTLMFCVVQVSGSEREKTICGSCR